MRSQCMTLRSLRNYFDFDLHTLETAFDVTGADLLTDYQSTDGSSKVFNQRIRNRICELSVHLDEAETVEAFKDAVTKFYQDFGVGKLGLHKAFRIEHA